MTGMPTPASTLKIQHVAIMKVETISTGRSRVTFRGAKSEENPSGIETAHTAPLWTEEGRAVSVQLRRRERSWPMTLLRTTAVGISSEILDDGTAVRVISAVEPTAARAPAGTLTVADSPSDSKGFQ
jgi:hypothetical protein